MKNTCYQLISAEFAVGSADIGSEESLTRLEGGQCSEEKIKFARKISCNSLGP